MKKTVKKPAKKTTKMVQKPTYISHLEDEVVRLAQRVYELERFKQRAIGDLVAVGKFAKYNQPKEPETFEDCCKMFGKGVLMNGAGFVIPSGYESSMLNGVAVPSEKRAKQLAAIAKMMTVADALSINNSEGLYAIGYGQKAYVMAAVGDEFLRFTTPDIAEKAIKILGEDTIKTAFGL